MKASAKQTAVKLLARREHSVLEIQRKLEQRDFPAEEIALALVELQQGGWLSDERYAEAYVHSRRLKGFGPTRIAIELRDRGVDEQLVANVLEEDDEIWMETLHQTYQRKYRGTSPEDFQEKAKRMRFLQYRGFSSDKIFKVVK